MVGQSASQRSTRRLILDLCGGIGAWSQPYTEAYDVQVVTLPKCDVLSFKSPREVHGILAAPPCTMFSLARTTAKTPRDFPEAMEIVAACLRIIWECRATGSLKWWALENPRGFLRQFLGRPAFTFKPSEFGDPSNKVTDLWGYFTEPRKLQVPVFVPKGLNKASAVHDGWKTPEERAITPPAFARAFFKANP